MTTELIPSGYMAKRVASPPGWLTKTLLHVTDVHSVSNCVNDDFADYINFWKHNGYWLFDSPEIIRTVANENAIDLVGTKLFYYEIYGLQFDGKSWSSFSPSGGPETSVVLPREQQLEGYDVVTFFAGSSPECSPLSCNGLAEEIPVNSHCLLSTFDEAKAHLEDGTLLKGDPGPYRIFAVYSVNWPTHANLLTR